VIDIIVKTQINPMSEQIYKKQAEVDKLIDER
jgi:hypothetical protein